MSFEIVKRLREFADCESETIGRDALRRKLHQFADKTDETIEKIISHYDYRIAKQASVMAETADRNVRLTRENDNLRALVKELADALNSNKCAHCCMPCLSCNQRTKQLSLVDKAREVCRA